MNKVYSPKELSEAFQILNSYQPLKIVAGGTDLMVGYNSGMPVPDQLLNLWKLDELRHIDEYPSLLKIGALCTYTQLIKDERVRKYAPTLVDAAKTIGAMQIQNRGTLGGNIVNASPAGDCLPVLAAFDAVIEIGSVRGLRQVPFTDFYTGYRQTVLAEDEMVTNILLPKQKTEESAKFYKVGTRAAQAISKVMMSVRASIDAQKCVKEIAIAVGSVAPTVIRTRLTEMAIRGLIIDESLIATARKEMMEEVRPITDIRSNEHYRRTVSGNLIAKFLRENYLA
ncbi:MAG: xanthine dehydrogenase family protein subunit M [Blastocatellia bacterium]|nr:xanthine dehydrogenase family protein subunit M [Blastocatellia bacterium]